MHITYVHETSKKFKCEFCQKVFAWQCFLNIHVKTIHKKAKCEVCSKEVKTGSMKNHMRTHQEGKNFKCQICQKELNSRAIFKDHVLMHSNPKAFQCNKCMKCLKSRMYLKQHQSKFCPSKKG